MDVVGNQYIDCFLTAGLGCHRVHHLLPGQKSGFANVISEPAVRQACKEKGFPWQPNQNYVTQRLPKLASFYFFNPSEYGSNFITESLSIPGFFKTLQFMLQGFTGFG